MATLDYKKLSKTMQEKVWCAYTWRRVSTHQRTIDALVKRGWLVKDDVFSDSYVLSHAGRVSYEQYHRDEYGKPAKYDYTPEPWDYSVPEETQVATLGKSDWVIEAETRLARNLAHKKESDDYSACPICGAGDHDCDHFMNPDGTFDVEAFQKAMREKHPSYPFPIPHKPNDPARATSEDKELLPGGLSWVWAFHRATYGENSDELNTAYDGIHQTYSQPAPTSEPRKVTWADLSGDERIALQVAVELDDRDLTDTECLMLETRGFLAMIEGEWTVTDAGRAAYEAARATNAMIECTKCHGQGNFRFQPTDLYSYRCDLCSGTGKLPASGEARVHAQEHPPARATSEPSAAGEPIERVATPLNAEYLDYSAEEKEALRQPMDWFDYISSKQPPTAPSEDALPPACEHLRLDYSKYDVAVICRDCGRKFVNEGAYDRLQAERDELARRLEMYERLFGIVDDE